MQLFKVDFPGANTKALGTNYRSRREIIDTFTAFSKSMKVSQSALPLNLEARRGSTGHRPTLSVAIKPDDEISVLAGAIESQCQAGIPYRRQALLCVSNRRLSEIASGLEARKIPVLHLGSLFERPEIKNLLSLLSLLVDPRASGLIRAATLPGFEMALPEVIRILEYLRENEADVLAWRTLALRTPGISEKSKVALGRLVALFDDLSASSAPWSVMAGWLIDGTGVAKSIRRSTDPQERMRGLAYWQFLNFCLRQPSGAGYPTKRLLDRIRRLVLLSEDRDLRRMPTAADGIDAVRLMTIHGSKGLEFDLVHLPGIISTGLPRNNSTPRCVPPDGLIFGSEGKTGVDAVKAGHDEEEECLFFVALSRARDQLHLYASSKTPDDKNRSISRFISSIQDTISTSTSLSRCEALRIIPEASPVVWKSKPQWSDSQINQFERCPRRFLYTHVLGLGGRRTESAFMKMHNVVSDVFEWLKTIHTTTTPSEGEISSCFDEAWAAKGAVDHGYAADYYRIGRRLVAYLVETRNKRVRLPVTPIPLGWAEGDILVQPDSLAHGTNGEVVLQRVKTGKARSNGFDDIEFTVLHLAAKQAFGDRARIEVTYLTSETTEPMEITSKKLGTRRDKASDFIRDISKGAFPAEENDRTCPRCPSYFICSSLPAGQVER